MFESDYRKREQQAKQKQADATNDEVLSRKPMLTPPKDRAAGALQRQTNVYAGMADHPRVQYDLDAMLSSVATESRDSRSRTRPPLQMKLKVGAVGDQYEQEADRVAAQVVKQINAPAAQPDSVPQAETTAPEKLQMTPTIQQRADGIGEASAELESAINRARGSGQPLEPGVQAKMGQVMGADFSGVRVHTDARADQLNQSLQAKAFTTGQDVFFRLGEYRPETKSGQGLLAHELTHVVQQTSGIRRRSQKSQNQKNSCQEAPILEGIAPKSKVLDHLQALRVTSGHDSSVYRQEILQFQQENSHDKIVASQQQVLELEPSVGIKQRDHSQTLRRYCNGGRTLTNTIEKMLKKRRVDYGALIQAINDAPVDERQAAIENDSLRKLIRESNLTDDQQTTVMSSLLVGSQKWTNPITVLNNGSQKYNNFYDYFFNGQGSAPTDTSTMNCWESIMYAAYLAGKINAKYIKDFYQNVWDAGGVDPDAEIWKTLGWNGSLPTYPETAPKVGQLLFYKNGGSYPAHVSISLGGDNAISLWHQPNNVDAVQRINVTDLTGTVYIANPPW